MLSSTHDVAFQAWTMTGMTDGCSFLVWSFTLFSTMQSACIGMTSNKNRCDFDNWTQAGLDFESTKDTKVINVWSKLTLPNLRRSVFKVPSGKIGAATTCCILYTPLVFCGLFLCFCLVTSWRIKLGCNLGGGFKDFLFSPLLGEDSHFD